MREGGLHPSGPGEILHVAAFGGSFRKTKGLRMQRLAHPLPRLAPHSNTPQ